MIGETVGLKIADGEPDGTMIEDGTPTFALFDVSETVAPRAIAALSKVTVQIGAAAPTITEGVQVRAAT